MCIKVASACHYKPQDERVGMARERNVYPTAPEETLLGRRRRTQRQEVGDAMMKKGVKCFGDDGQKFRSADWIGPKTAAPPKFDASANPRRNLKQEKGDGRSIHPIPCFGA